MTVTKLNRKDVAKSLSVFISGAIGIGIIVLLMIVINEKSNTGAYIRGNVRELLIIFFASAVLTAILYCYFLFENKAVFKRVSKMLEIFILLYLSLLFAFIIGKYVNAAARPLSFLALMGAMLFKTRDSIFLNTIFAFIMLVIDRFTNITCIDMNEAYASLLCTFCTGIVAIFVLRNVKTRIGSVLVALALLIPVEGINFLLHIPDKGWNATDVLNLLMYGALDSLLSIMLFMVLLPVFEFVFAELTAFRLRELTSDDAKLIKKLKTNAPGTYNHSAVVAQIVEACAREIGEDSELARAAAYYHDVGKLKKPEMFAENQTDYNFHAEFTPELSVDIIRSHARDGAKLIKKSRLPDFFADVAVQHHGTLPIKYFYAKALKMSDGELNIDNYSYSGPTPATKIAAMIMIADASEAATRSLSDRSPANVESLVRTLIEERLDLGQFDDCNITMRELSIIKSTIVNQLTGVYHSRVSYPKLTISKKK
ncbi:MAG: HDIG domain-containing protein [Clostridia bacterium]|nr:HDIG domain-containing protein [Clostridia bacterium]